MNMFRKTLAILLSLTLVFGAIPLSTYAADTSDVATAASAVATKPADGTVTGEPFDTKVSANHRIPGLVNHNGTLIATADARWDNEKDGGGSDLVVSRSTDGNTWNYTYAGYLGDNGNVYNADSSTLMDPVIISDGTKLYLLADMYPAGYSISSSSTTNTFSDTAIGFDSNGNLLLSGDNRSTYGYYLKDGIIYTTDGDETEYTVQGWYDLYENGVYKTNLFFADSPFQVRATSYICMSTSTDGGETWSSPELLNVKPSGVAWMVLGPGSGIVTEDGNLAFTAYDGSNIYLIYGKDGSWNRVQTSAAANESSIVELNDGTIRAFVKRGGNNTIAYVDFTKTDNGYTAGNLVDTGVTNFSQCMVSSLHYSKTLEGKEVVLVCCPSLPGSGAWNGRFNGKIHMFTLDGSNNMTLINSYALNGTSDFFAYSNMTELNDGTIGVLYEDDCISYSAGSYTGDASHITYTNVNLETAFNVTFDKEYKTVTDATTDVTVTAPDLSSISIVKQDSSTPAAGYDKSVTYSITLTQSDGTNYTGPATVKIPAGDLADCIKYIGHVDDDEFAVSAPVDGYFTLNVPHFSDVTISGAEAVTKDLTLYVGYSKTVTIDGAAYSDDDVTTAPDSKYAEIDSVTGQETTEGTELVPVTEIESGKQYLLYNNRQGNTLTATYSNPGLLMSGDASVDNTNLWTITASGDLYTVRYGTDGGYLNVGYGTASVTNSAVTLQLDYIEDSGHWLINDNQGWYGLNDYQGDGNTIAAGWTSASTDSGSWWTIYEVVSTEASASTDVTFTGVAPGTTTAVVGDVTFNLTVKAVTAGDITDFNNIVGVDEYSDDNTNATYRSDLDMEGQVISKLTISAGASFHLGVDVAEYDSIEWTVADKSIATVDANGNVTGLAEGETTVTATVIKDGKAESISIPVVVKASLLEEGDTPVDILYYIEQVDNTTPYYTMYLSSYSTTEPVYKLTEATEGEVIFLQRPANTAWALVWTAAPKEGHALTLMGASGTINEFYPLRDQSNNAVLGDGYVDSNGNGYFTDGETEYYYTSDSFSGNGAPNNAYKNVVLVGNDASASWRTNLNTTLSESLNIGCDGALSSTRWDHDGVPKVVTAMTFISDPMPKIEKSVAGILPTTRKQADFETYYKDMVASVGELVYFKITVTLDRPTVWTDDAQTTGAINYTDAILTDDMLDIDAADEGSFYVKAQDTNNDGIVDSNDSGYTKITSQDITDALNAEWAADETTRVLEYYYVYEIRTEDIPKFLITNTAEINYEYKSEYSTGAQKGLAEAKATITVVGSTMDNVVVDFGQSVVIEGLTDDQLKGVHTTGHKANYGEVSVTKETDGTYTLTYKPTEVLQGPDSVRIYGDGVDENNNTVTKVINGFAVYPATTVYYEESFLTNSDTKDWDLIKPETETETQPQTQTLEYLAKSVYDTNTGVLSGYKSDKKYNYGYDPAYDSQDDSNSYISSETIGASTSTTFTGTGVDVYANCLTDTGYVSVRIKDATSGKTYLVNTVAVDSETATEDTESEENVSNATKGQTTIKNAPIVSVRDLKYGTYDIIVTKVMDSNSVQIDGFRVYNAVEDSSVFSIDLEDNPVFYELRDEVLAAATIDDTTSDDYGTLAEMSDQVYSVLTSEDAAVIVDPTYSDTYTAQDLLDKGPKNELLLHAGATLIFKVTTKRDVQVGMKAPNGETSYTITGATETKGTIKSTVDQFYDMGVTPGTEKTYTFTITNTGSNNLSVTLLKICDDPNATFNSLTEADIESALIAMGYGPEEPETPVEPTPGTPDEPSQEPEHECIMKEEIQPATTMKDGKIVVKCEECGEVESTKIIRKASNVKLSMKALVYNGKQKNPKVIVKDSKGNVIDAKYYKVTKPKGRTNVGKYTYTVKFNGLYKGTKKLTLTVKPKATAIKSVTAAKKAFTVKWSKVSKQATGYEIMYATNAKFTKGKHTVKVTKLNTTSKKISKLKANKKYYVKVRTYKTVKVNGKQTKIYSNWSKYRTVTTKR